MSVKSRIALLVEAQGARRAANEIDDVARSTRKAGDESDKAGRKMRSAGNDSNAFRNSLRGLSAAAGVGAAAASGFASSASAAGSALSDAGSSAVGAGGGMSRLGPVALVAGAAFAAMLPMALGVAGALTAIAGSAAAAGIGLGALGAAGVGALAVGLSGIGLLLKDAAAGFKTVSSGLDAYNLAVQQYGKGSEQATDALERMNAVVAQSGGPAMLAAVRAVKALTSDFKALTRVARGELAGAFGMVLGAARRLLPTFAQITNRSAKALVDAIRGPLRLISGGEMRGILTTLGDTFAKAIGPLANGMTALFLAVMRVAQAAAPYVVQIARAFERWAVGVGGASANGERLTGFVSRMVGHLQSWASLLGAVGGLVGTVFGAGASYGRSMVDSLTGIVERTDAWLKSAAGQESMHAFFRDAVDMARTLWDVFKELVPAVAGFVRDTMPGLVSALNSMLPALKAMGWVLDKAGGVLRKGGAAAGAGVPLGGPGVVASLLGSLFKGKKAMGGAVRESGLHLVGERGPEIRWLGAGDHITPNHELPALADPAGADGMRLHEGSIASLADRIISGINDKQVVLSDQAAAAGVRRAAVGKLASLSPT
jgi:hypothetical protein